MEKNHLCLAPASVIAGIQLLQEMGKYVLVFYRPLVMIQHRTFTNAYFRYISSCAEFLKSSVNRILCSKEAVLARAVCFKV